MTVRASLDDEIVRAAYRVTDESVRLIKPVTHDGSTMILVPLDIYERLERAVCLHTDVYGRPKPYLRIPTAGDR